MLDELRTLLAPKWLTARARARKKERGRAARTAILLTIGAIFWAFAFGLLHRLLAYFRGVPEIGPLLAGKLLGLIFVSFFSILLLSNIITALSSVFLARDLDLLASAPVDWLSLYTAKLLETCVNSSWMVVLMAVPMLTAYGTVYDGGPAFIALALLTFLPFLIVPAALGSALTLVLVNAFPARRTRDILSVIAVLAAAGLVVLFRLVRPEKLARPEGFRSLVEFISILRTPTSPLLPSEWLSRSIMGWLTGSLDPLPLYLLWSTAAAAVAIGALLHRWLYARGFTKAQKSGERWAREGWTGRTARWMLTPLGVVRRELVLKEIRVFFRDTTQWSQLILLAVLVVVYVFNIKFLPLTGEGITFFIVNLVPFLNLALAGFVLASVAARLALAIVGVTNSLLHVSPFMFAVSVFTITLMTFALAGMAIGFGTVFPRFETENAAQIPTSFGGLLYMMSAVGIIGAVIVLEARPVYSYLSAVSFGGGESPPLIELVLGFGLAAAVCLTATFWPIRIAKARLEALER